MADSILSSEYIETLTTPTSAPRVVSSEYVEAVTTPTLTPRSIDALYIEVVTPAKQPFRGWGVPV